MKLNKYKIPGSTQFEIVDGLKCNPNLNIDNIFCMNPESFNSSIDRLFLDFNKLQDWHSIDENQSIEEFHNNNQKNWRMPVEFKNLNIKDILISKCDTTEQKDRVIYELTLYEKLKLIPLLQYLTYLMTIIKANNIILGVGRGSSCASYCLFLLGIHRVDSIKYHLDIHEFLRER